MLKAHDLFLKANEEKQMNRCTSKCRQKLQMTDRMAEMAKKGEERNVCFFFFLRKNY